MWPFALFVAGLIVALFGFRSEPRGDIGGAMIAFLVVCFGGVLILASVIWAFLS